MILSTFLLGISVRHIFTATQQISKAYPRLIPKLPETLQYIYDKNWFPQKFVNFPKIPSENIQKRSLNRKHIEIIKYNADTIPFSYTKIPENINASLEASPIENMNTIIHNQPTENRMNDTTETDFTFTLLDDGTLFSSHAVNTIIILKDNNNNNNNYPATIKTTDTHLYQNHQNRHPINSTELTQNLYPLNTTIPPLPNINTLLPRLNRQNTVHFNLEPVILNTSTPTTQGAYQNIQITPQQLVKIVRQLNSQNAQQTTNAPTPYY